MRKLHEAFNQFDKTITLTQSKKDQIIKSRNAVRDKIRKYFRDELKMNQPKFKVQGSFAINTALNPTNEKEVDTDDGLYLQHLDTSLNKEQWAKPREMHQIVVDALKNHTQDGCEDKTSCVRVIYAKNYHVDIPIYVMENNIAYLANAKTNQWEHSDSKEFKNWFYENRKNDQTSRIVRYLKAWRDNNDFSFASIELTILVVKNHYECDFDEIALQHTVQNICSAVSIKQVFKPIAPFEDLWSNLTDAEKNRRIKQLEGLYEDIKTANQANDHRASKILREQFGDRFPIIEAAEQNSQIQEYSIGAKPWRL